MSYWVAARVRSTSASESLAAVTARLLSLGGREGPGQQINGDYELLEACKRRKIHDSVAVVASTKIIRVKYRTMKNIKRKNKIIRKNEKHVNSKAMLTIVNPSESIQSKDSWRLRDPGNCQGVRPNGRPCWLRMTPRAWLPATSQCLSAWGRGRPLLTVNSNGLAEAGYVWWLIING